MPALAFVLEFGEGGTRHHRLGFLLQLGGGNYMPTFHLLFMQRDMSFTVMSNFQL
jgi:hypothetical protein